MTSSETEHAANRRWLIGVGITLVFGVFGAVMALLSYTAHGSAPSPAAAAAGAAAPAPAPASPDDPTRRGRGKGREK